MHMDQTKQKTNGKKKKLHLKHAYNQGYIKKNGKKKIKLKNNHTVGVKQKTKVHDFIPSIYR